MNTGGEREFFQLSLDMNHLVSCKTFLHVSHCVCLSIRVRLLKDLKEAQVCIVLAKEYDCFFAV